MVSVPRASGAESGGERRTTNWAAVGTGAIATLMVAMLAAFWGGGRVYGAGSSASEGAWTVGDESGAS